MEVFKIVNPVHPSEEGFVEIDISVWLNGDTIKDVTYTAKNARTNADATATVLDLGLSTFSGVYLRPYLLGGSVNKVSYKIIAMVECNEVSDIGAFVVEFVTKAP